jgi:ABC-2 type transport system ATP-binding protein
MIEVQSVSKYFGDLVAVDQLSFSVGPGEVLGFLGPNGAGKSTTMKMITGFIAPSQGTISVCGHRVDREPLLCKREIGYLPEGAPSYSEMTPSSFLAFIADLRGLKGDQRRARLDYVIERLGLGPVMRQTIDTLSKGFKRRVGLAQAVLHNPRVLILDEPTDGLDPNQKHEVRELIRDMSSDKIIIISTHILEEVDAVCSRAMIIAKGKLLADDTPENLAARSPLHNAVNLSMGDLSQLAWLAGELRQTEAVSAVQVNEREHSIRVLARPGATVLEPVQALLANKDWAPKVLHVERGRLDEVFRDITGGNHR